MSTIDDINNSFAYDKQRNNHSATTQQQQGNAMVIGQFGRGNIDLYNRPQYKNPDGKISTVRSMSANIDGKEVLLPTVSKDQNGNPILLSNEEAIQRYKDTGEHLGIFDSVDEANRYAEALHQQQENYYSTKNKAANPVKPETLDVDGKMKSALAKRTMSYADMMQQLSPYKPPTEEELVKERRKQKRDAVFAAIGDGLNAFHQAYANARGVKPIAENTSISGKMLDRYEKLKKERDARTQEYLNAYLRAAKADQQQENWRDTFKYNQERDAKSDAWRQSEADRQQGNLDRQFNYQKERDEKSDEFRQQQFEESKRQFNVSSSQAQQRLNHEAERLAKEMQKENVSFALGTGKGTISVPTSALNASNVAYVFSKLPKEVRATVKGDPIIKNGKLVTQSVKKKDGTFESVPVYAKPTTDAMLIAIGSNIENAPAAQDALREISGQKTNVKKPNPMGGNKKKPNPMI